MVRSWFAQLRRRNRDNTGRPARESATAVSGTSRESRASGRSVSSDLRMYSLPRGFRERSKMTILVA